MFLVPMFFLVAVAIALATTVLAIGWLTGKLVCSLMASPDRGGQ